jgi:branched-chain amino acid transport system ATP-binding protein
MLEVDDLTARYGPITGLRNASISVRQGEIVAVVGPNGAGKTTMLASIAGLVKPAAGRVIFDGVDVTGQPPERMLRRGLALVPERRRIFSDLSVFENLLIGGVTVAAPARRDRADRMMGLFPVLAQRRSQPAGFLSGGEAQQLAIARALMSDPKMILMDEPSLGLAPILVDLVMDLLALLRTDGRTILVVEQNVGRILDVADRGYVMRSGSIVDQGSAPELRAHTDLFATYLGADAS